jgi:hypothetical protein
MDTETKETLLSRYYEKNADFVRLTTSYQYIFEVTKCCGYGEWVSVFKDRSLSHLYENIKSQFGGLKPRELCVLNESGDRLLVPEDETITIKSFVLQNPAFFRPIYPVPAFVIYRIYYDEGCCHLEQHNNNNLMQCDLHK